MVVGVTVCSITAVGVAEIVGSVTTVGEIEVEKSGDNVIKGDEEVHVGIHVGKIIGEDGGLTIGVNEKEPSGFNL